MSKTKVLIVEDEEGIRETLEMMLEDDVDIIHSAENGQQGLELFNKNKPYNCIISDINMPVMNGVEFIKKLREQGDDTLVIFFTAYGTRELMYEAVKYGAFEFVSKPDFTNLNEIISSAIKYSNEDVHEENNDENLLSEYKKLLLESKTGDE